MLNVLNIEIMGFVSIRLRIARYRYVRNRFAIYNFRFVRYKYIFRPSKHFVGFQNVLKTSSANNFSSFKTS